MSGINCAYRLQSQLPNLKFAVFEARNDVGGTWDLFKYPGIRSDSDLYTYGFSWEPWPYKHPIAEGELIVKYLKSCVDKHDLGKYLNFSHKVSSADWSSVEQRWTVEMKSEDNIKQYTSRFVVLGSGYYDYNTPLKTEIPGIERFRGKVIHPQFWPEEYDYTGKKIAVIGSGATAVTLVPNMAKTAQHVTMVQRSPSYVVIEDNRSRRPPLLGHVLPARAVDTYERWRRMLAQYLLVLICRHYPLFAKAIVLKGMKKALPAGVALEKHFTPAYTPWEQRVCLSPDGDFFEALRGPDARASVVTGRIETVTETGLVVRETAGPVVDGEKPPTDGDSPPAAAAAAVVEVEADVLVTATGLRMEFMAGIPLRVDGAAVAVETRRCWNGAMLSGVPNLFFMIGYVDASWTLGADATAYILTRLWRRMARLGVTSATPRESPAHARQPDRRFWALRSTYSEAAHARLPRYGAAGPWRPRDSPPQDHLHARYGDITTGLQFGVA